MDKIKIILILIIIGLILLLGLQKCNSDKKQNTSESNLSAINDSLHHIKDKLGKEIAYSQIITGNVTDLQLQINSKDSVISTLAKLVDKKTKVAVVGETDTKVTGKGKTAIVGHDTIRKHDTILVYPVYKDSFENEWESGKITASKDSIKHHILIRNKFSLKDSMIPNGFLKPKAHVLTLRNENPNTTVRELKSFLYEPKPANKGWWAVAGVIVGGIITIILVK
jgi:hypothetical protein